MHPNINKTCVMNYFRGEFSYIIWLTHLNSLHCSLFTDFSGTATNFWLWPDLQDPSITLNLEHDCAFCLQRKLWEQFHVSTKIFDTKISASGKNHGLKK
jgi:hypothetical protein